MASRDRTIRFSHWPFLKVLRNCLHRMIPMGSGHRKLKMLALKTDRLVLRKIVSSDLEDIVAWDVLPGAQDSAIAAQEFLNYCFREYRTRGIGPWGMQLKQSGALVGNCGFPEIIFKDRCGEVNYYVWARHRGQGLALEALNALLKFGFNDLGLIRIQARCDPDNLNSERVMQKAGMTFEGLTESARFPKDTIFKQKLYAILEGDFNRAPSPECDGPTDGKPHSDYRS